MRRDRIFIERGQPLKLGGGGTLWALEGYSRGWAYFYGPATARRDVWHLISKAVREDVLADEMVPFVGDPWAET